MESSMSRWRSIFGIFPFMLIMYEFAGNLSNDMYVPAMPTMGVEFGTSYGYIQATVSLWLAGNASMQLLFGPLSDRFGRRPVLFWGGLLFLLATLGAALSPSIMVLLVFRFLQGIGVCSLMISAYTSINELYDDKNAVKMLALFASTAVIGPMIGPVLGGYMLIYAGWRATFWAIFALASLGLLGLWFTMPESLKTPDLEALKFKRLVSTYSRIVRSSAFLTTATTFGLVYSGSLIWITASPYLIITILGYSPAEFGWAQFPVYGSYILGAWAVRYIVNRFELNTLALFGLLISAVSGAAMLIATLLTQEGHLAAILIPMSAYSFGFGLTTGPLSRATIKAVEHTNLAQSRGAATALFYLWMLGIGVIGTALSSLLPESIAFTAGLIACVGCLALVFNQLRLKAIAALRT